jgi:hypothetical protein
MPGKVGLAGVGPAVVATEMDDEEDFLVVVVADLDLDDDEDNTPTQYASPTQKFVVQSELTAGFHARNCAVVSLKLAATVAQLSPETTSYQRSPVPPRHWSLWSPDTLPQD